MKKIILLLVGCFLVLSLIATPAVISLSNSYKVNRNNKLLAFDAQYGLSGKYEVSAERDSVKYKIAPENLSRIERLLQDTKQHVTFPPDFAGIESIVIKFGERSTVTVYNYDELNDLAYLVYEDKTNDKAECFKVEKLNLYSWLCEVIDEDGFSAPNEIIE